MPFVKLDTGILDSSLWVHRDPRDVFVTALLMALPHELHEPTPALEVRAIKPSGFVIPPGWYGHIGASGSGITRRAGLDLEAGMLALEALASPDFESRSEAWEGRRLVRVNGGFIVLNFMNYRDKDNTNAERQRRFRERQKIAQSNTEKGNVTRYPALAEAEAEAEALKKDSNLSIASARGSRLKPSAPALPGFEAGEENPEPPAWEPPDCPHLEVLKLWAEVHPQLPQHLPSMWKGTRAAHLRARWRETATEKKWTSAEQGITYLRRFFTWLRGSPFLMGKVTGRDGRAFELELSWLVNPTNWAKTHEGKYHG